MLTGFLLVYSQNRLNMAVYQARTIAFKQFLTVARQYNCGSGHYEGFN